MTWIEGNGHWVLLGLLIALAVGIPGFLGLSALVLLAGAFGGASLGALLGDAALVVGVTALMVVAEALLAVALVKRVLRRLSFPTSDRLATLFSVLEAVLPPLRALSLSRRFRPGLAERERAIKDRYVGGELTEREFEREMHDLLADAEPRETPLDHRDPLDALDDAEAADPDRELTARTLDPETFECPRRREAE